MQSKQFYTMGEVASILGMTRKSYRVTSFKFPILRPDYFPGKSLRGYFTESRVKEIIKFRFETVKNASKKIGYTRTV